MAISRRPMRMVDSGVQPQRSVGDVLLEEAGRAGIGLVGGVAQAALQPLVTSLGAEGSIGRQFVSPEIREMKRQEAESMSAARVAPYYQAQQGTEQRRMQEAGQTQRAAMGIEGTMEQKQLGEGSDILQLGMKLRAQMEDTDKQLQFKQWLARFKRTGAAKKNGRLQTLLKVRKTLFDAEGYNPDVIGGLDAQILQVIGNDPVLAKEAGKTPLQATPKSEAYIRKEEVKAKGSFDRAVKLKNMERDIQEAKANAKGNAFAEAQLEQANAINKQLIEVERTEAGRFDSRAQKAQFERRKQLRIEELEAQRDAAFGAAQNEVAVPQDGAVQSQEPISTSPKDNSAAGMKARMQAQQAQ